MHLRRTFIASIVAIGVVGALNDSEANAQLIAADSLNDADYVQGFGIGALNGQNPSVSPGFTGNAWVSGSANIFADAVSLTSPAVTYDDTSDGKGKIEASSFDFFRAGFRNIDSYTPANTYYMSFLLNSGGSFVSGSREHAVTGFTNFVTQGAFDNSSSDNVFGLMTGFRGEDAGAATDTVDLILRARDVATGDLVDTVLVADAGNEPFGFTYQVVLKLDVNVGGGVADDVTYWVNPTDLSSEAQATATSLATGTVATAAMDQNDRIDRFTVLSNQYARSLFWDEPRLAYDFTTLVGTLPVSDDADFDGDTDVDLADLMTWQRGFLTGTTQPEGDANGSGTIDADDLAVWEAQFGGAPLVAIGAVPEPASFGLCMLAVVTLGCVRRNR